MNLARSLLPAGLALALLSQSPLLAQISSPVPTQTGAAGDTGTAAPSIAVPQTNLPPAYNPPLLDTPAGEDAADRAAPDAAPKPRDAEAPAAPSEYETYVSSVAGKPLRRFGSELLMPEARDYVAPPTVAVPLDYRINPGDQLRLGLTGSVQASNLRLTVDSEGRIFVPRVGAIRVGGVRYGDVHSVIAQQVSRQYRGFELEVSVARLRGITVYVTGFARQPGSYTVNSLSTLVNAVLAAGGPTAGGSFRSIQLRRGGELISDFDLYDLLLKGDKSGDAALQNGDVIHINPAGAQVAVIGSVNREAIFEMAPDETVDDAIRYAGGISTVADDTRVMMLDALGRADGGWQQVEAAEARTRVARRGEVVRVLSDIGIARPLGQQSVLVTISGEVAKPGRYYVRPGTPLSQVVQQAGGLTVDAFPYASIITRETVKAQQQESFARAVDDMEMLLSTQPLVSANRAVLSSPSNKAMIDSVITLMREREPSGRLVFDLPVNATALPGDLIVENNDMVHVPSRPVTVGVFGAVASPASFAYRDGMTIGDFVKSAGGIQSLGDKGEIFVVRANGTVLARGGRALKARALPGDLIYVPVDANRGEFWARLRDITSSLFGGLVGAASLKSLTE